MASSLLILIDDIATLLDDVAVMTKVAAKKTAGVLGDDLALNAQQVTCIEADRELPVIWAVAKGSLRNKAILAPTALAISAMLPSLITPLLMVGGLFLCYEGAEKILHHWLHTAEEDVLPVERKNAVQNPLVDMVAFEKDKIKGAIRTDFILSAEIMVITLGSVASAPLSQQFMVLASISLVMTIGVYGLVAGIVKLDDAGLALHRSGAGLLQSLGNILLALAPRLMRTLSVLGTAAMFLVGGGILLHSIPFLAHAVEEAVMHQGILSGVMNHFAELLMGALAGVVVVGFQQAVSRLK